MSLEIILRRNWYSPIGQLLRTVHNPHLVPEEWKDKLPSECAYRVVEDDTPEYEEVGGESLSDFDTDRVGAAADEKRLRELGAKDEEDAEAKRQEELRQRAEEFRREMAEAEEADAGYDTEPEEKPKKRRAPRKRS